MHLFNLYFFINVHFYFFFFPKKNQDLALCQNSIYILYLERKKYLFLHLRHSMAEVFFQTVCLTFLY